MALLEQSVSGARKTEEAEGQGAESEGEGLMPRPIWSGSLSASGSSTCP